MSDFVNLHPTQGYNTRAHETTCMRPSLKKKNCTYVKLLSSLRSFSPAGFLYFYTAYVTTCCCWVKESYSFYHLQVGKAASGVDDLNVTDLTAHPPTPWCRRVCGGCELKQAGYMEVSGVGLKVRSPCQRHHQQHVLWDSDACRPSLKPFPVAAPAASTAGIRLPEETQTSLHNIQFHFCTWLFLLVV